MTPVIPELPVLSTVDPVRGVPRRRWRALLPPAAGLLFTLVPGVGFLESVALVALGLLGGVTVWTSDARSGLDGWQRAFRRVSLRGVKQLPREARGVKALARVCEEVEAGLLGLEEAPRRGWKGAVAAFRARRQLQALPAYAASLAVTLERLGSIPDPRVEARCRRVEKQLTDVPALARRVRAAALRQDVALDSTPADLLALDRQEQTWAAQLDCADELDALEALFEGSSA